MIFRFFYFKKSAGASVQLIIDTEKKTVKRGFFLFHPSSDAAQVARLADLDTLEKIAKKAFSEEARNEKNQH